MAGPTMQQGISIHTATNVFGPQMISASPQDDDNPHEDAPDTSLNSSQAAHRGRSQELNTRGTEAPQQMLPPMMASGMDTRKLVLTWADSYMEAENMALANMRDAIAKSTKVFGSLVSQEELSLWDKVRFIDGLVSIEDLEMVGLFPADGTPFVESSGLRARESSADAESVLALGLFARARLNDDLKGSLRKKIEERYGKDWNGGAVPRSWWNNGTPVLETVEHQPGKWGYWWGDTEKQFDVFAIEGLVGAPGLDERAARSLLSKIEMYALKENKIVVVPKHAYISSYGTDLTDYYVHLGFEKVELEGRLHELVYTGASSTPEDLWVENQQIMLGMNILTGV